MTRTDRDGRLVMRGVLDFERGVGLAKVSFEDGAVDAEYYGGEAEPGDEGRIFGTMTYQEWVVDGTTYWVEETEEPAGYAEELIVPFPGNGSDPRESRDRILRSSSEVRPPRRVSVRGTPVTHYALQLDPKKLAPLIPPDQRPDLSDPTQNEPFDVELWVDEQERAVRIRVADDFSDGSATTTYDFFDFGVDVDVSRPTENVITRDRLEELTRPDADEMRELCEEEIPADECADMEKESE